MIHSLENEFLQFTLSPGKGSWNLYSRRGGDLGLEGVRIGVTYRQDGSTFSALDRWELSQVSDREIRSSSQGVLHQLTLVIGPDSRGLRFVITFALLAGRPLFMWQMSVENNSARPVHINRLTLMQVGNPPGEAPQPLSGTQSRIIGTRVPIANPAFFSNGWGSWNFSGSYGMQDRFRRTRLGFFAEPLRVNAGTPQPKEQGHFASDMFGVLGDRSNRAAILAGFLSQEQHFGSLEAWTTAPYPALQLWANGDGARLDPGRSATTDWACLNFLNLDEPDPLGIYLEAVARQHAIPLHALRPGLQDAPTIPDPRSIRLEAPPDKADISLAASHEVPTGWCSWYQFFQDVTTQDLRRNLEIATEMRSNLPLDVFQIDDGFETRVGDWFSLTPNFSKGMAPLAEDIRTAGFTPGLWLAPFIVDKRSRLASEHPEWLLRGKLKQPVNAGFLWQGFATALDLTHPDALTYTTEVVNTAAQEWGYTYLKLDFLYAAALPGRYRDSTLTRAQILRKGLQALRQAVGADVFLLGCGCPLGSAIGLVDAMRIGADVDVRWRPAYHGVQLIFKNEPDYPSAFNAIQNTLTRLPMHRRWWINDPDCLLLRPDIQLTLDEVQSLASVIVLTGGMLFLSDDLTKLPEERLRIARSLMPLINKTPRVMDWFDSTTPRRLRVDLHNASGAWHLLALFNWDDVPRKLTLRLENYDLKPDAEYLARDFWNGTIYHIEDGMLQLDNVPPHGTALLAMRLKDVERPVYLGSDLHISQGLEVSGWRWDDSPHGGLGGRLTLELERPGRAEGQVAIMLPGKPRTATLNGHSITWYACGENYCYRFPVEFERRATLDLTV